MNVTISLQHGCKLKWTTKSGLWFQRFGVLFTESTSQGFIGSKKNFFKNMDRELNQSQDQ